MKKLMLLGGIRYLLPVIEAAHRTGMQSIVDMPDKKANQFIMFAQNNGGVLPADERCL